MVIFSSLTVKIIIFFNPRRANGVKVLILKGEHYGILNYLKWPVTARGYFQGRQ